ncbi:hypothetical protein MMC30_002843 [Trapelia coarctata]|nr:hypothetical protein [Trapelia coarctata]
MRSPLSLLIALLTITSLAFSQQTSSAALSSATTTLTSTLTTTLTRTVILASPTSLSTSMNHTTATYTAASSGFLPSGTGSAKSSGSRSVPSSTATLGPYQVLGAGSSLKAGSGFAVLMGVIVGAMVV